MGCEMQMELRVKMWDLRKFKEIRWRSSSLACLLLFPHKKKKNLPADRHHVYLYMQGPVESQGQLLVSRSVAILWHSTAVEMHFSASIQQMQLLAKQTTIKPPSQTDKSLVYADMICFSIWKYICIYHGMIVMAGLERALGVGVAYLRSNKYTFPLARGGSWEI